ncbi:hypothetical protein Agub_g9471 [Astrephomene gubernaculifera]|uniref:Uncharacterized protein n=1 Tax=Astrephomene gubernaculifera TaxID=47775 RepID=A0AAD3DV65_9CHLO|nr:hypothetical protein Agub_g9471 [Astrephomene gubernaculifera]
MGMPNDTEGLRPTDQQNDALVQVVHDDMGGNPHAEPSNAGDAETFIVPEVVAVLNDAQSFFSSQLLPRARQIESEVANLTYEANSVTERAETEKTDVLKELGRLSELVLNFQSRISQFLHFGAFGGQG